MQNQAVVAFRIMDLLTDLLLLPDWGENAKILYGCYYNISVPQHCTRNMVNIRV